MKKLLQKFNTLYIRFDRWFEKKFGWFFTNAEKAEDLKNLPEE